MDLLIILYLFSFLRTLFIILIIYYGVRFIIRYLFPFLLDKGMKNMQHKMQDQQQQRQRATRTRDEVTIEYNNSQGKSKMQNKGEYVDFEEVD
jgi:uncharacterized membrane protein (DUF106 family)